MMPTGPSSRVCVALILLGCALRLAALPLPGTSDVGAFKIWTHAAATGPVSEMYGVGGSPPERRVHDYDGGQTTVNYPPVALYELAFVGALYGAAFPGFPNGTVLTAAVKLLPVAAEVGLVWLLGWTVRRLAPRRPDMARFAMLAFWLNPAAVLTSAVLGYVDALFTLPALGALVAASQGHAALSGVLLALAILTKPQAIFIAPVVGLALLAGPGPGRALRSLRAAALGLGGAALAAGIVLAPVVAAGAWANFRQAMLSFGRHDMLSGQAANLWWIVTYVMRAIYAVPDLGVAGAFFSPVRRPLGISTIVQLGYPNPRLLATAAFVSAIAWALWKARRVGDAPRLALLGAWCTYAYFMLAVQVHENHFFMILPLLAMTAAVLPEWRKPFWVLSMIFAMNLYLFYGLGEGVGFGVRRSITGLDATVWLSMANLVAFIWFGRRLRLCLEGPAPSVTSDREGIPRQPESSCP